jgi:phosphoglycerate kinase
MLDTARAIRARATELGCRLLVPEDAVVAPELKAGAPARVAGLDGVGPAELILDIGPRTVERYAEALAASRTALWNGPLGAFEMAPFDAGTRAVAEKAAELTKAGRLTTVAGGGDTVAALNQAGVASRFSYVSTAGGAFLEFLEGKRLPGVEALRPDR